LLTVCRKELCEQVFDEIIDTIVMKVQRQIDESRRIAKDHDGEPDLHIEVRAAPSHFKISLLSFKQAIILAGGLSQNPYLKGKMRAHFESHPLPEQRPISIQIRPS
jgi:tRNA A37 threonylcarbamoyltransferase TsaD